MSLSDELRQLGADMVAVAYLKGDFLLSSGRRSNYYFDKYLFEAEPSILRRLGKELAKLVPPETQRLAAPELGAILLGAVVSLETGLPIALIRKEAKEYGTSKVIEGRIAAGEQVTLIEDVLTTGGEAIRSAAKVRAAGAEVVRVIVAVDREEGADANFAAAKLTYTPLFRKSDLTLPE
ncbi:MAG: orotate phosphoribosyltransferase [Chloroflexi bacterium]|nr:orotate phosphoribosyltransferase [Chloroflexota bacterium]